MNVNLSEFCIEKLGDIVKAMKIAYCAVVSSCVESILN